MGLAMEIEETLDARLDQLIAQRAISYDRIITLVYERLSHRWPSSFCLCSGAHTGRHGFSLAGIEQVEHVFVCDENLAHVEQIAEKAKTDPLGEKLDIQHLRLTSGADTLADAEAALATVDRLTEDMMVPCTVLKLRVREGDLKALIGAAGRLAVNRPLTILEHVPVDDEPPFAAVSGLDEYLTTLGMGIVNAIGGPLGESESKTCARYSWAWAAEHIEVLGQTVERAVAKAVSDGSARVLA